MTTTEQKPRGKPEDKEPEGEKTKGDEPEGEKESDPQVEFPQTIGGKVYNTVEELKAYVDEITKIQKEVNTVLKTAGKVGRPASQKRVVSELVSSILNQNMSEELTTKLANLKEDTSVRIMYNPKDKIFSFPPIKTGGGGGTRSKPLTVDGIEYTSAKKARETLHSDTVGKQQNRASIITFLKNEKHTVVE